MENIQVILTSALLRAVDGAAKHARMNRSSLISEALHQYPKGLAMGELEARDSAGYRQHPDVSTEASDWERLAAWPEHWK